MALISCTITAHMICVFVLAYAKIQFSYAKIHFSYEINFLHYKTSTEIMKICSLKNFVTKNKFEKGVAHGKDLKYGRSLLIYTVF